MSLPRVAKIIVCVIVTRNGKMNINGAFCHDRDGSYMGSLAMVFSGIDDPTTLETLVCRECLEFCKRFIS